MKHNRLHFFGTLSSDSRKRRRTTSTTTGLLCALLFSEYVSRSTIVASTTANSFPARIHDMVSDERATVWLSESTTGGAGSGGGSSDDEAELSSSEFEDDPNTTLFSHNAPYATGPNSETSSISKKMSPPPPSRERKFTTTSHGSDHTHQTATQAHQSQPLQTLQKLQQMLDDTDYMTSSRNGRPKQAATEESDEPPRTQQHNPQNEPQENAHKKYEKNSNHTASELTTSAEKAGGTVHEEEQSETLWTSKDRAKYKKQQQRLRKAQESRVVHPSPPIHHYSSDDEVSDDTDDGLGYRLPNLPVYFSDAEAESDIETASTPREPYRPINSESTPAVDVLPPPSKIATPNQQVISSYQQQPPPPPHPPFSGYYHPYGQLPTEQYAGHQHQYPPYMYPPNAAYPLQYGPYYAHPPAVYAPWPHSSSYGSHTQAQSVSAYHRPLQPMVAKPQPTVPALPKTSGLATESKKPDHAPSNGEIQEVTHPAYPVLLSHATPMSAVGFHFENPQSLAEASSRFSFDSIQKVSLMLVTVALLCYSSVSPRTLPLTDYNTKFYENVRIVSLATILPLINLVLVFDARLNDVNSVVNTFFASFTLGYVMAFAAEVLFTTLIRLAVFFWFEPNVFSLTPTVPVPVLPWVLRENKYRPKRITLFAADLATSCVACPIIEEYVKLKILQWTVNLPRNFVWVMKTSNKSKRRRLVAEAIMRRPGEQDILSANQYVTHMLAASIGLKLSDAGRRILMYTKPHHANKSFYALFRGIFPIHELCGTMTALNLAKRDLLGVNMPLWKLLLPSVVIHGMANFRGMKPIFKWNSATPWSEMQLSPWNVPDSSTFPQLLKKGYAKLMWLVLLGRVLGYCIKNYYMVNRQAVKRTTTYAGNHAAFSAELATAEVLKKTQKS